MTSYRGRRQYNDNQQGQIGSDQTGSYRNRRTSFFPNWIVTLCSIYTNLLVCLSIHYTPTDTRCLILKRFDMKYYSLNTTNWLRKSTFLFLSKLVWHCAKYFCFLHHRHVPHVYCNKKVMFGRSWNYLGLLVNYPWLGILSNKTFLLCPNRVLHIIIVLQLFDCVTVHRTLHVTRDSVGQVSAVTSAGRWYKLC